MNPISSEKPILVAVIGGGTSLTGWFLDVAEPTIRFIILVAQAGAAIFTALYFYFKWRKAKKDSNETD